MTTEPGVIMVRHTNKARRRWSVPGRDPRSSPLSTSDPIALTTLIADCGKTRVGRPRQGCRCGQCVVERAKKTRAQREKRRLSGDPATKKYEKTPKGYLMRSYRNMQSRVLGIQKTGSWTGKELLPREEFYEWALNDPVFRSLFMAYEALGFDRRFAPSPDRIDSSKGYTLDNLRWVTHSINSSLSHGGKKAA